MPKTPESPKPPTADEIAELADHGKDVSRFFTNAGRKMYPIQRVNVDFTLPMLQELEETARNLNQPAGRDQNPVAPCARSAADGAEGAVNGRQTGRLMRFI
jgi:hypothetical protein